jgi:hypothetical protein
MKSIAALLFILTVPAQSAEGRTLEPEAARQAAQGMVTEVLETLARKDFRALSSFVGSEGLTVSPYVMLNDADVRLSRAQVESCATDAQVRHWGDRDGSGDPIEATCSRYFDEFVWDADYRRADEILYNEPQQRGNEINNNHAFAPDGIIVELHMRGKGVAAATNWKSLRLIFRKGEQGLVLLAITRDMWTI